uniref:PDZ domain-containing protein n=2 Tax=Octopus bimaculoides TaxID=37653 RepID=A0A0L8G6H2_OCTBM
MRKSPRAKPLDNPAFSDQNESIQAEEGISESIKDHHSPNKTLASYNGPSSLSKKDWNSLPKVQFAGTEYGSYCSLNSFLQDPEIVSADLLSQDFTGLGFNISGNMREGIYIDEVRNRGPAKESGKLRAGK